MIEFQYDAVNDVYWVPVCHEMMPYLEEWSEPVQVKIEDGQMVFRRVET